MDNYPLKCSNTMHNIFNYSTSILEYIYIYIYIYIYLYIYKFI